MHPAGLIESVCITANGILAWYLGHANEVSQTNLNGSLLEKSYPKGS